MSSTPFNEASCRRPDFTGGVSIPLCNGESWSFPTPKARFVIDDSSERGYRVVFSFGPEYQALVDQYDKAEGGAWVALQLKIAAFLLRKNYSLTNDQISELVQFSFGDDAEPELEMMRSDIMGVAFGQAPKRSADGSSPASKPTE